ncbi:MAG: hypothetical protein WKF89_16350 [Chitinophagaceae bacterium]
MACKINSFKLSFRWNTDKHNRLAQLATLLSLVLSLTKGEKKYFTMQASLQKGAKDYLRLFNLITKRTEAADLKASFLKAKHTASYETSCKYLFSVLTKYLIQLRQEENITNQLVNGLLRANLFFEKSLYEEGFLQLKKIKEGAAAKQQHLLELWACRLELNYQSQLNFHSVSEKELIQLQMHMDDVLCILKNSQQHHNLYELMRQRLSHKGTTRSTQQTAGYNDLVVTELGLMNMPPAVSFQSQKAHLLFQANYFLTTNNYPSALKLFYQLHDLFEKHRSLWQDQPQYYIFMMEGILNSLRTVRQYQDLAFFLSNLQKFETSSGSAQLMIEKITYVYSLASLLDNGEFEKALAVLKKKKLSLLLKISLLDATQQAEVYLYTALTYFVSNHLQESYQYLRSVLLENKLFYNLPVYKTFRLIRLLVHYELGDHQYISYEARSIKRSMQKENQTSYLLEKTLLKFLQLQRLPSDLNERLMLWEKLKPEFDAIREDKYESQLLKLFDVTLWVESTLCKKPLNQLLILTGGYLAFINKGTEQQSFIFKKKCTTKPYHSSGASFKSDASYNAVPCPSY